MGARSSLDGLFQLMVLPKASAPARGPSSHQDRQLQPSPAPGSVVRRDPPPPLPATCPPPLGTPQPVPPCPVPHAPPLRHLLAHSPPPPLFFAPPPHRSDPPLSPTSPPPVPCSEARYAPGAGHLPLLMTGPPQAGGAGGRCVSPLRRVVSMVLCGPARLLSQPACSASPPVLLLGFAAGCVG